MVMYKAQIIYKTCFPKKTAEKNVIQTKKLHSKEFFIEIGCSALFCIFYCFSWKYIHIYILTKRFAYNPRYSYKND